MVRVETLERITDFSAGLYSHTESQRPIKNIEQISEDLWTWWAEADLRPSPIKLFIKDNGLKDKYGNDLVSQSEAASIIRKGRIEQDRVEAEVTGVKQLRDLLISGEAKNGIIYLSPPGKRREGFDGRRISFTYLYHVGNAGRIHFLAVPELEVSALEHFNRVFDLIDEGATAAIAGVKVGELNDRKLVAYPFLATDSGSLDSLSQQLGYKNLLDLWKQALEAKRLRGRVGEVIKHASQKIWEAHHNNDKLQLEVLSDVFRGVVALMTGKGLDDVDNVVDYFDTKVDSILSAREIDRLGGATYTLYAPYLSQINEFQMRINNNPYAKDVTNGGSCPTGDKGLGLDIFGSRLNDQTSNHIMMDILGNNPLEATSQDESYSFDHEGECVVCKKDPRMLGPCNICEQCDHKIRSQVE